MGLRVGAGFGVLMVGLAASGPVRAEGEFMRDAMSSIGLIEPERAPITYNERAPLVMPPSLGGKSAGKPAGKGKHAKAGDHGLSTGDLPLTLPPPRTRAEDDPAWPKDPEVVMRERAAAEDRKPRGLTGGSGRMNDNNATVSLDEMERGRRGGAAGPGGPGDRMTDTRESNWLNPIQMLMGKKAEDEGPSQVEPQRTTLAEPPTGYRRAPIKVEKPQGEPVGRSISGNEEADPRAYHRNPNGY